MALAEARGADAHEAAAFLEIAGRLGWAPSSAARALSDGKAGAIGLAVDRPALVLGTESFFMRLVAGIQEELGDGPIGLLLQSSGDPGMEQTTHKRWYAERRVDGVLLTDLRRDDPRVEELADLRLPAVAIGGPSGTGTANGGIRVSSAPRRGSGTRLGRGVPWSGPANQDATRRGAWPRYAPRHRRGVAVRAAWEAGSRRSDGRPSPGRR